MSASGPGAPPRSAPPDAPAPVLGETGVREYFALVDVVKDFDKNLLVVKGWGATVSTVTLAAGFQSGHYGIFLVAALAGVAFWAIEATMKQHQMRHYVRMREIEYLRASPLGAAAGEQSTPMIDWSWTVARAYFTGARAGPLPSPERYRRRLTMAYLLWALPHVALPHVFAVVAGGVLFLLGSAGRFNFPL